jgi:hypothetical protein
MEDKVNYLMHGLEHDLFPCNFSNTGKRQSWGIGFTILPDTTLTSDPFAFNQNLQRDMVRVLDHVRSFSDDYKKSDQLEPQFVLNYLQGYVLNIECYIDNGTVIPSLHLLSRDDARNFILAIGADKFYDLMATGPDSKATYER